MVGKTGIAQTGLSPQGKVFVHGELWDAVSSADISVGQLVVVRQVDGLILRVDPIPATQSPMPTPAAI
jgi:membrane-bound serine protease (ClpP class)